MSSLHNPPPARDGALTTRSGRPDWLLPVALCGGMPVVLSLIASFVLLTMWVSRGSDSPKPQEMAATTDSSPSSPQAAAGRAVETAITGGTRVLDLPQVATNPPYKGTATAFQYAYDPNEGRLAIIGPWRSAIGFIDLDEQDRGGRIKNIAYLHLTGEPIAVAYEESAAGGRFVAGTQNPAGIVLLNSDAMQVMKVLKVNPETVGLRGGSGATLLRGIDWERLEVDSSLTPRGHEDVGIITADRDLAAYQDDYKSLCLAQGKPYVAYQHGLYSRDGKRLLTKLEFSARTFVRDGTLVAGVTEQAVVVGSLNDGHILASVPFPADARGVNARRQSPQGMSLVADVFLDKRRDCIVVGLVQDILILPLQSLAIPDEPILLLSNSPPAHAHVNTLYECSLETISGNSTATLLAGPRGMRVEDGSVRWTPQKVYEGPVDVRVTLVAGDVHREESWRVWVEDPQ